MDYGVWGAISAFAPVFYGWIHISSALRHVQADIFDMNQSGYNYLKLSLLAKGVCAPFPANEHPIIPNFH
jgi:hypothetical protein